MKTSNMQSLPASQKPLDEPHAKMVDSTLTIGLVGIGSTSPRTRSFLCPPSVTNMQQRQPMPRG